MGKAGRKYKFAGKTEYINTLVPSEHKKEIRVLIKQILKQYEQLPRINEA